MLGKHYASWLKKDLLHPLSRYVKGVQIVQLKGVGKAV